MFEYRKRVVLLAAICALAFVSLSAQTADTSPKATRPIPGLASETWLIRSLPPKALWVA